jgi:putative endonuclease
MTWYFYVVRCRDLSLYAGITTDITRRVRQHNAGKGAKCLRPAYKRPVVLVYYEKCSNKSCALKREDAFKRLPRNEKGRIVQRASWI